jgi:hypothetical protein
MGATNFAESLRRNASQVGELFARPGALNNVIGLAFERVSIDRRRMNMYYSGQVSWSFGSDWLSRPRQDQDSYAVG